MTVIRGTDVARSLGERVQKEAERLAGNGVRPCAAILRVGENPGDIAYERGAVKKLESLGIGVRLAGLPAEVSQNTFMEELENLNGDPSVHGILLLRPLPPQLDEALIAERISPCKDVDAINPDNLYKVLAGDKSGFAPCTPEAVMAILDHIGEPLQGKKVTVIGRSLVVGKPLALLALDRNATVTVCHSRTEDLAGVCREADVLLAAVGRRGLVTADHVAPGAIVVDVGINVDDAGKLCGDVDFESAAPIASYITPVPGGVGSVTTTVLADHVVRAAKLQNGL